MVLGGRTRLAQDDVLLEAVGEEDVLEVDVLARAREDDGVALRPDAARRGGVLERERDRPIGVAQGQEPLLRPLGELDREAVLAALPLRSLL